MKTSKVGELEMGLCLNFGDVFDVRPARMSWIRPVKMGEGQKAPCIVYLCSHCSKDWTFHLCSYRCATFAVITLTETLTETAYKRVG